MTRACLAISIATLCGLASAAGIQPENEYPVAWYYIPPQDLPSNYQHYARTPQRTVLQLSIDGGETYPHTLGYGLPSEFGTNTWIYSLPRDPELLTEHAQLRLVELPWAKAAPGSAYYNELFSKEFQIAGVHISAPAASESVTIGEQYSVRYRCAGVGDQVQIGITTNVLCLAADAVFEMIAIQDSDAGTNAWQWTPSGSGRQGAGQVRLVIQSLTDPKCLGVSEVFTLDD